MELVLTPDEWARCKEFAKQTSMTQQSIEFGQRGTKSRSNKEKIRDTLIGKLAEQAIASYINTNFNLNVEIDYNVYPRGEWDSDDISINGWKFDIKATRSYGEYLLVDWNKLRFRRQEDSLSHVYIMAITGWDRDMDVPINDIELCGYAFLEQLEYAEHTLMLRKGECLPNKKVILQTDNWGIHKSNLHTDLDKLISVMMRHSYEGKRNLPQLMGKTIKSLGR